ncbi:MAG: DUF2807 domain-containing protein [Bacteroidetes bacterium]|nr:DUF2807 domain-containing protein [Bacteroidota bacterium]
MTAVFFLTTIQSCKKDCFAVKGSGPVISKYYQVPEFTSVSNSLNANLIIVQDSVQTVQIDAQSNIHDILKIQTIGSQLQIGYSKNCGSIKHDPIMIYIHVLTLSGLNISGSGNAEIPQLLSTSHMTLSISGSGNITAAVQAAGSIKGDISGSGNISLSGICENEDFHISGSGSVNAFALQSEISEISISGSGDADVLVNQHLDASISGSGDIRYKGNAQTNVSVSGSGTVTHVE